MQTPTVNYSGSYQLIKGEFILSNYKITMLERWIDGLKFKVSNPNTDMNS